MIHFHAFGTMNDENENENQENLNTKHISNNEKCFVRSIHTEGVNFKIATFRHYFVCIVKCPTLDGINGIRVVGRILMVTCTMNILLEQGVSISLNTFLSFNPVRGRIRNIHIMNRGNSW